MASPANTSLRVRVGVLGCIFLALVVFAVGLSVLMVRSWNRALDDRVQTRVAAAEVSDLRLAYSDQETGIRGFLLTDDPRFLEPYRQGAALAQIMEQRLRAHSPADGIDLDEQIDQVNAAADQWRTDVVVPSLDPDSPPPDEELSRERFNALRVALEQLDSTVASELDRVTERTDDEKRNTFAVLIASAIAAFGAVMLVAMMFRRWVTQPLALVGESARALSIDDEQELPDFDSAELQEVVDAIRALQRSLAHERDRAVTAYRALEQSAVLALHVRSELADELGDPPPGWSVGSALVPAEGVVAGDCFDLGLLDQHRLYVVMVDVTGHGAAAALDALKSKSQLRAAMRSRVSPGGALDWLSRENRKDERADLLTAVVAVIDVDTGVCQYANAGHPPPILTNGETTIELGRTGPLLGAFESTWQTETVTIDPGWTLLLYTDGVTEAMGAERQRFGDERFAEFLHTAAESDPKQLVSELLGSVAEFQVGTRTDDVTVVVLRRSDAVAANESAPDEMDTVQT